jgi:tetratricopeptide (TPR) repeat protein
VQVYIKAIILYLLILLFVGCALPKQAPIETQDFISKRELLVARLVKQSHEDFLRGRMPDAELGLRKALLLAPDVTQISLNLGRTLARNGQIEEATQVLEGVLKRKPRDLKLINFIGESFYEAGETKIALNYFKRALVTIEQLKAEKIVVEPALIYLTNRNLSTVNFKNGDLADSLCFMTQALEAQPGLDNMLRVVRVETALGAYQNAETRLSLFQQLTPGLNDARLFILRAIVRLALNQKDKAIEDINAALKREETIGEYVIEMRLLADALIEEVPVEGEESIEEPEVDEEAVEQTLSDLQRLYLPLSVLEILDRKQEEKEMAIE